MSMLLKEKCSIGMEKLDCHVLLNVTRGKMEGDLLHNWSSTVEELVDDGSWQGAVKVLEGVIDKLEGFPDANNNLTLAAALNDVGEIYASHGFSIKADSFFTKAFLIKQRACSLPDFRREGENSEAPGKPNAEENGKAKLLPSGDPSVSSDEDWEVLADQTPKQLKCPQVTVELSKLSLDDNQRRTANQRGRGVFTYGQSGLYSDQTSELIIKDRALDESLHEDVCEDATIGDLKYGTSHVLVVDGFPPKVATSELERLFEGFIGTGVAVRRINDSIALAVFRKPSSAREALTSIHSQYNICALDDSDNLLGSLSSKDLEPPFPRPATSAQTAQRMIVGALQSQGLAKRVSPKCSFHSIKKQEDDRRNRILTRQKLRDEAWGSDE